MQVPVQSTAVSAVQRLKSVHIVAITDWVGKFHVESCLDSLIEEVEFISFACELRSKSEVQK
jgi:hypothetical protein